MEEMDLREIVRAVMFGKQKQANVQLDATVDILVNFFSTEYPNEMMLVKTPSDFTQIVTKYLQGLIESSDLEKKKSDRVYIKLLCGVESFAVLTSPDVVPVLDIHPADPDGDSPKILFRVTTFSAPLIEDDDNFPEPAISDTAYQSYAYEREPDDLLNAEAKVQEIIDKVAPLVPNDVAAQLGHDRMKMALYGAPTYFGRLE